LLNQTFKNFYRVTGHQILERYGMTETNMNASNPCNGKRKAGSVGKPLKDIKIRINNIQSDNNKSENDIGTIEINGPNVFKGYLNNPKKTQEAFTKDGFFITGDIGYFDNDGYLYISGRNKDLIISGGYNVYPKEIEDIINQHELVLESAVFGIPNDDLGEVPIAAIVMKNNSTDLNDLKDFLKKAISGNNFVFIDSTVAMCIAVGILSFDDWDILIWSLGWSGVFVGSFLPNNWLLLFAMTSLRFILIWVPDPVCHTTRGKW